MLFADNCRHLELADKHITVNKYTRSVFN